jgi:hypothetical protein
MARPTLPLKTNRSADRARTFATPVALNLQTVSGCPDFGPQRCVLIGTGVTGIGSVTLVTEDNASLVIPLSGQPVVLDAPVKTVTTSTTAVVLALWWVFPTKDDNQLGPFPLNP